MAGIAGGYKKMEAIIALMIPIFAVLGAFGVAFYGMYNKTRQRELHHEERKFAMEKGLPIPEEIVELKNPETRHKQASLANRKTFVILFFLGLAFAWFFPHEEDSSGKIIAAILCISDITH